MCIACNQIVTIKALPPATGRRISEVVHAGPASISNVKRGGHSSIRGSGGLVRLAGLFRLGLFRGRRFQRRGLRPRSPPYSRNGTRHGSFFGGGVVFVSPRYTLGNFQELLSSPSHHGRGESGDGWHFSGARGRRIAQRRFAPFRAFQLLFFVL